MSTTRLGTVESISVQGANLFAVIRYKGEVLKDMMGNDVNCGRSLAGVPSWTPEKEINMAEILLPLSVAQALQVTNPNLLIGANCIVHLESDVSEYPISATILSEDNARLITRRQMWNIRNMSADGVLDDLTKLRVAADGSISMELYEGISKEIYDQEFHKGMVGVYGTAQDPFRTNEGHMNQLVDFSTKIDEDKVTGIGTKKLRTRNCYAPATVFTGRS